MLTTGGGPVDGIAFAYSGAAAEGFAAFSSASNVSGISFTADRFGTPNSALVLPLGAHLDALGSFPTLPVGGADMSLSAWVQCAPFTWPAQATIIEWGPPAAATSASKISLSASGMALGAFPGPIKGICDQNWHHVALVQGRRLAAPLAAYVDGVMTNMSSTTTLNIPAGTGNSIRIGWNGLPVAASTISIRFTSVGSTTWTVPSGVTSVNVLVVAGGGGGGGSTDRTSGGGGAGGFVCRSGISVTVGQVINVTVGAGGLGGSRAPAYAGLNGQYSSFGTIVAAGGGGGGAGSTVQAAGTLSGKSGGSGGGVAHSDAAALNIEGGPSTFSPGSGVAGQGNSGGRSPVNGASFRLFFATGGGGAGAPGKNAILPTEYGGSGGNRGGGGSGGAGLSCAAVGTGAVFAGGGGGSAQALFPSTYATISAGAGGAGGGGSGCFSLVDPTDCVGYSGEPNTGGGGGGGGMGGNGGSGIVIVSWTVPPLPPDPFAGAVADLRLYKRALSESEVFALAEATWPTQPYILNTTVPQPCPVQASNAASATASSVKGVSSLVLGLGLGLPIAALCVCWCCYSATYEEKDDSSDAENSGPTMSPPHPVLESVASITEVPNPLMETASNRLGPAPTCCVCLLKCRGTVLVACKQHAACHECLRVHIETQLLGGREEPQCPACRGACQRDVSSLQLPQLVQRVASRPQAAQCGICLDTCRDPVTVACRAHQCCRDCLKVHIYTQKLGGREPRCPACKGSCQQEEESLI